MPALTEYLSFSLHQSGLAPTTDIIEHWFIKIFIIFDINF